ncbi:uncharacterized protein LOC134277794 [Saccostrea cucullata]|uniref:uncharacterized protein LOC134277794 n=1 Tax=Saccostrea cuccullata TaxID=36930 RepID=UPI002ED0E7B3
MDTNGQRPDETGNGHAYPVVQAPSRPLHPRFSRDVSTQMTTYRVPSDYLSTTIKKIPPGTNGQTSDELDNGNTCPVVQAPLRRIHPMFSRNASTQMTTYCVTSHFQEKVKEAKTQTFIFQYIKSKKYKTAVIVADFPPIQPVDDDDIEVAAGGIPRLSEEVQRHSVPPLEVEQRQPTPPPEFEQVVPCSDFDSGPEMRTTPPLPGARQHRIRPGNDALVRVGGGWMEQNYHQQKHCTSNRKCKPTADRYPVIPSLFHPSCKMRKVNKSHYASVTVMNNNRFTEFSCTRRFLDKIRK